MIYAITRLWVKPGCFDTALYGLFYISEEREVEIYSLFGLYNLLVIHSGDLDDIFNFNNRARMLPGVEDGLTQITPHYFSEPSNQKRTDSHVEAFVDIKSSGNLNEVAEEIAMKDGVKTAYPVIGDEMVIAHIQVDSREKLRDTVLFGLYISPSITYAQTSEAIRKEINKEEVVKVS